MMNNNPLFSVLIAQYNNVKYLQEAIDSVKSQTYKNWEIILIDDASTDNSHELYKLYEGDDQIKIYYNKKNKGCGYTKYRCAKMANGEICGFLDSDDVLLSDALELMINEHLKDENISLVYSKHIVCDENLIQKYVFPKTRNIPENNDYLHFHQYAIGHFVTFKRNLYNKTEGINPQFIRAVDQDLYLKMEEVGSLVFINRPLYMYRIHKNGISTYDNGIKAFCWYVKVVDNACQRRGIVEENENIVSEMIIDNFIEPLNQEIKSLNQEIELLNKKIYNPSLKDVFRGVYRYIHMFFNKRLFKS